MPKPLVYITLTVLALAMIPPALIARARTANQSARRIHLIQDMDNQAKYRAQHGSTLFEDGRAMRPPVEGTIARGDLQEDITYWQGLRADGEGWIEGYPEQVEVSMQLMQRGEERFNIYCTPCHGVAGYGDGMINERANELVNNPAIGNGTVWVNAKSVHDPDIRDQPPGQIYNTITNGIRTMPPYAEPIPVEDRWAITLYVKALQRSQNAVKGVDVPEEVVETLEIRDLRPPPDDEGGAETDATDGTAEPAPAGGDEGAAQ